MPTNWTPDDLLRLGVGFISFLVLVSLILLSAKALPGVWKDYRGMVEAQTKAMTETTNAMNAMTATSLEVAKVLSTMQVQFNALEIGERIRTIETSIGDIKQRLLLDNQQYGQTMNEIRDLQKQTLGLLGSRRTADKP